MEFACGLSVRVEVLVTVWVGEEVQRLVPDSKGCGFLRSGETKTDGVSSEGDLGSNDKLEVFITSGLLARMWDARKWVVMEGFLY